MPRHVALLRGVNVGTAKRVAMADLRALVEDLGFHDVRTLLNSGNLVYTSPRLSPSAAGARIEQALAQRLGVSSKVIVLEGRELSAVVEANPLVSIADNHSRLMVFVLAAPAARAKVAALVKQTWGRDKVALGARAVYGWFPNGFLESPLRKALDRALGNAVTTRNWATVMKLAEMVKLT
jgi:uncharacterized protein (DUF1697 family)